MIRGITAIKNSNKLRAGDTEPSHSNARSSMASAMRFTTVSMTLGYDPVMALLRESAHPLWLFTTQSLPVLPTIHNPESRRLAPPPTASEHTPIWEYFLSAAVH